MPSTPQSLVLGFAANIPPDEFRPFFTSLGRTGYVGRTALVVTGYDQSAMAEFAQMADIVIPVAADGRAPARSARALRLLKTTRGLRRLYPPAFRLRCRFVGERRSQALWTALEAELEGLQSLRYGFYQDFLAANAANFDQVLIADVRDVVFQGDPFEAPLEQLEVFLEDPSVRFGTDHFNGLWLRDLEGRAFAARHADRVPSCCGTVAAPLPAMQAYLGIMRSEIAWRRIPMGSHDQGVHNALMLKGRLDWGTTVPNGSGRVLTMGAMAEPGFTPGGTVRGPDGTLVPVIHQYDRFPEEARAVLARLG